MSQGSDVIPMSKQDSWNMSVACARPQGPSRPATRENTKVKRCRVGANAGVEMLLGAVVNYKVIAFTRGVAPVTTPVLATTTGQPTPRRGS